MKERLARIILNAVAFAPSGDITAKDGLARVEEYLHGLGRFGNSAFICCMYGIGSCRRVSVV